MTMTRWSCRGCGTKITLKFGRSAKSWPCLCGKRDYTTDTVTFPALPIDPEHDEIVDRIVNEARAKNTW